MKYPDRLNIPEGLYKVLDLDHRLISFSRRSETMAMK
jgi:hypothetical protein